VFSLSLRFHFWGTKFHPWVPSTSRNVSLISRSIPLPRHPVKSEFLGNVKFLSALPPTRDHAPSPLHDLLSGSKVKFYHPVTWSEALVAAFNMVKVCLSRAALLSHPNPTATIALVTDVSTTSSIQRAEDFWQPLAFSRKLSPAKQKYSAYDTELLAIYETLR